MVFVSLFAAIQILHFHPKQELKLECQSCYWDECIHCIGFIVFPSTEEEIYLFDLSVYYFLHSFAGIAKVIALE